ncbi:MAG: prepilin-type N-terminal cleavage/methylation domain-containing protein [Polyangiaceae bacterium]|nr:prepilin-type N-terminal cleavage/methylation domain-containing protein [Polyangiaceae bacterium]
MAPLPGNTALLERVHARRGVQGFTLAELLVVVVIIGVLSVVAIPALVNRMRDRRVRQAGEEIATLYRNARLQAMGRGSAVLVRYTKSGNVSSFEVREAVWGGTTPVGNASGANCQRLPSSSCSTNTAGLAQTWATANPATDDNRVIDRLNLTAVGQDLRSTLLPPTGAELNYLDVCFSAMGRSFRRTAANGQFVPLVGVHQVNVGRYPGAATQPVGVERMVAILPNGAARILR